MGPGQDSDERLMHDVALGRRDAFAILVRRYAHSVLTLIRRMGSDPARSEDLFQEVFLAVWAARHNYRHPRPFRSWLFGIAVNKCREFRRNLRRRTVSLEQNGGGMLVAADTPPVNCAIAAETAMLVQQALFQLPPQQRAVVVLRIWNALTYAEIGEILNCRQVTARSTMLHALTSLRRFLEPRLR